MYSKITDNLIERAKKKRNSDVVFFAVVLFIVLVMTVIITLNTYVFFQRGC